MVYGSLAVAYLSRLLYKWRGLKAQLWEEEPIIKPSHLFYTRILHLERFISLVERLLIIYVKANPLAPYHIFEGLFLLMVCVGKRLGEISHTWR